MDNHVNIAVAAVFDSYPPMIRHQLIALRALIYATAAKIPELGPLDESLKWGEPTFRAVQSKRGTAIRLGWHPKKPSRFALLFNCKTQLIDTFRTLYPELHFEGNRAICFNTDDELPTAALAVCIEAGLTYLRLK
jgi:hypothetical protein